MRVWLRAAWIAVAAGCAIGTVGARQDSSGDDAELVANGTFRTVQGGRPAFWDAAGDARAVTQSLSAATDGGVTCARLNCTRIDGEGGAVHAMLAQVGRVQLSKGVLYEFSCRARQEGIRGRSVSVAISDMSTWSNCGLERSLRVDRSWGTHRFVFRATRDVSSSSRLQFWFLETGTLFLADVSIRVARQQAVEFTDVVPARSGVNMLANGSFQVGGAGWSTLGTPAGWGNLARLHGTIVRGESAEHPHYLRIPMGEGRAPVLGFDYYEPVMRLQTRALAASRGWIRLKPWQPTAIAADMRASVDGTPALVGCYALDPTGSRWNYRHENKRVVLTTKWERHALTFGTPLPYAFVTVGPDLPDGRRVDVDIDDIALTEMVVPMGASYFPNVEVGVEPEAPGGAFVTGRPARLFVRAANPAKVARTVTVALFATDYFGRRASLPSAIVRAPAGGVGEGLVTLPQTWRGWYRIDVAAANPGPEPVSISTRSVRVSIGPRPSGATFLGVNHAFPDPWLIPIARMAGVSLYRDWSLKWQHMEPTKGTYRWELADTQIDRVIAAGAGVMALLPPFPSAEWSSTAPASLRTHGYPGERIRQAWAPSNPSELADFARRAVARYRGRIGVWEFLNEPIYTDYSLPGRAYKPADYVRLLHPVAAAIRSADPRGLVMGGAGAGAGGVTRDMIDAGLLDQIDILNLHIYPGSRAPEGYIAEMDKLLAEMARRGKRLPIWITEFSYYGADDLPRKPFVPEAGDWAEERLLDDERQCAEYTVRFCAIMLARGCEKVFLHSGSSGTVNLPAFECCLFEQGGAPRKVAPALGAMADLLGPGPRGAPVATGKDGVYASVFETGTRSVAVVWATTPGQTVRVLPGAQCRDIMGRPVAPGVLALSEAPIYVVGPKGRARSLIRP